MGRQMGQKLKLLVLQKILLEKTDEEHGLTSAEIIAELDKYGIKAERKSLYDDLKNLELFGLDVCRIKSNTTRYYIGNRDFQLAELKLLVDAIQSSKFITRKKSMELIEKLQKLVSKNQGNELKRQVYISNRVKTLNEKIYYNVDSIHNAISDKLRIKFIYTKWQINPSGGSRLEKVARKDGKPYCILPLTLCWDDENYYMIGYDFDAEIIKHYRVDKMESIELCDKGKNDYSIHKDFDPAGYSKKVFSMYGGKAVEVTLLVDNSLAGVIADRFGGDVFITREDENHFKVTTEIAISPQFFAWIFGLGDKVKILSPDFVSQEYASQLKATLQNYEN